jgi:hypothetical protein
MLFAIVEFFFKRLFFQLRQLLGLSPALPSGKGGEDPRVPPRGMMNDNLVLMDMVIIY